MKPEKLHTIAPTLADIRKKPNSFKVPANYFESFEDGVIAELFAENLSKSNKKTAFEIPEDYLNTIEDNIITKIKSEAIQLKQSKVEDSYFDEIENTILKKLPKEPKKTSKIRKLTTYTVGLAIAASFAFFIYLNNTPKETTNFDSLAITDIEQSINNGAIVVNQVTLAAAFPNLSIESDEIMTTITDDEIFDYLNNQNIDSFEFEN